MPSIELSKLQAVTGPRALADTDRTAAQTRGSASDNGASRASGAAGVSLEINNPITSASAPVDRDRVSEIREALRDGSYPLVPAEIADAMIAAQLSFGIEA